MQVKIHLEKTIRADCFMIIAYIMFYIIKNSVEFYPDILLLRPISSDCRHLAGEFVNRNLVCNVKIFTLRMIKANTDFLYIVA